MKKELLKKIEKKILEVLLDEKWYTTEEVAYFLSYKRYRNYIFEALQNLNAKGKVKKIRERTTNSWKIKSGEKFALIDEGVKQ